MGEYHYIASRRDAALNTPLERYGSILMFLWWNDCSSMNNFLPEKTIRRCLSRATRSSTAVHFFLLDTFCLLLRSSFFGTYRSKGKAFSYRLLNGDVGNVVALSQFPHALRRIVSNLQSSNVIHLLRINTQQASAR